MTTGFSALLAVLMASVALAMDNGLARRPPMGWSRFDYLFTCWSVWIHRRVKHLHVLSAGMRTEVTRAQPS